MTTFDECWARADLVPGWLTREQAHRLWITARGLPPHSTVVEIGSHQGRSTVVLATAVRDGHSRVVAIDPFVEGRLFGGRATRERFEANVVDFGVSAVVSLHAERSQDVRARWTDPVDLLYIDGKHDYWTCTDDLRWSRSVRPGGLVLVHDAFSSVGVTTAILAHAWLRGRLAYAGRDGSLARFEVRRPVPADRVRIAKELPWWVRNVAIKVLLRLRLGRVARALGHVGAADPY